MTFGAPCGDLEHSRKTFGAPRDSQLSSLPLFVPSLFTRSIFNNLWFYVGKTTNFDKTTNERQRREEAQNKTPERSGELSGALWRRFGSLRASQGALRASGGGLGNPFGTFNQLSGLVMELRFSLFPLPFPPLNVQ